MGQQDSSRIQHDPANSLARDDLLRQIVDDLLEEDSARGFNKTFYLSGGVFIDKIENWDSPSMTKLRSLIQFTYSPLPFISQIVKQVYNIEGTAVIATSTSVVVLNANKTVQTITTTVTRP